MLMPKNFGSHPLSLKLSPHEAQELMLYFEGEEYDIKALNRIKSRLGAYLLQRRIAKKG